MQVINALKLLIMKTINGALAGTILSLLIPISASAELVDYNIRWEDSSGNSIYGTVKIDAQIFKRR